MSDMFHNCYVDRQIFHVKYFFFQIKLLVPNKIVDKIYP